MKIENRVIRGGIQIDGCTFLVKRGEKGLTVTDCSFITKPLWRHPLKRYRFWLRWGSW